LASEASVEVMRGHVRARRFTLEHYVDMFQARIDQAEPD
jgi:hypothetical protein